MFKQPVVNKTQYSEAEAAQQLGISIEDLRGLICRLIAVEESDANTVSMISFLPSDLLVLRLLKKNFLSPVS